VAAILNAPGEKCLKLSSWGFFPARIRRRLGLHFGACDHPLVLRRSQLSERYLTDIAGISCAYTVKFSGPYTTVGYPATGVPCYSCDPNAGYTIAIPIPISQRVVGTTADITLQWDDVNYTGACTAPYALVQGTTAVANGSVSGSCGADSISYATFTVTIPAVKGATRVVGTIEHGAKKSSSATLVFINNGK
jgi:hypothetical protein